MAGPTATNGVDQEASIQPITLEEELRRNPELRATDIALLREWADKVPHLPKIQDRELALFLQYCNYSVEAAKVKADNYFTARTHLPEFFSNRDPKDPQLAQISSTLCLSLLPKKTPEGYTILFFRLVDTEVSRYVPQDGIKLFFMLLELLLLKEGAIPGLVMIMDMESFTLTHMTRLSPFIFKKFFHYFQEGLPLHLKGMHFINVVPFMDMFLGLMTPFMNKEVRNLIRLYTADNIEKLYENVSKDVMPENYGGTAPSYLKLYERQLPHLLANAPYFSAEEQRCVDESRRPGRAKSAGELFGVEGTFRKLNID